MSIVNTDCIYINQLHKSMKLSKRIIAPIALILVSIILIIIHLLSTGVDGETDSIGHFQIARYAFKYPAFFLDQWGKPLFTILAAPLSQFGYAGALVFNMLCGLLSAWFAYLIAKRLEYRHAWVAIVFTIFTPVYLFIMYTSLTEILFSTVLIAAIYLFINKHFTWSAILISVIPFARAEGMMFIILFIPALIMVKQYKSIPFLLSGFIVFSIIGWPVYHDLLWFFTKLPYGSSGSALYGSGTFWYYFGKLDYIINYPLLILGISGLAIFFLDLKKGLKNPRDIKFVTLYFLIIPSFFGFILAQSFLWWQGMMGVLASTRFIACVLPLGAIIALNGFERVMAKAYFNKIFYFAIGIFILGLVIYKPFTYKQVPMKTGINFAVMKNLADWLKTTPYNNSRAFYSDPMFPFYMKIDPFDSQRCFRIYNYENTNPASLLKPGELLIWDAQFSGFEGHLPFDSLMKNNNLRLMNIFTPVENFTIIGGAKYKLAVFMKAPRDTSMIKYKQFYFNDFESGLIGDHLKHVTSEKFKSGKQSEMLTPDFVYSFTAEGKLKELPGFNTISLRASVNVLNPSSEHGKIILVITVEDPKHKIYKYSTISDSEITYTQGAWFNLTHTEVIDKAVPADGIYKVYVWYNGNKKIYVDDLKLECMPVGIE